MQTEPDIELSVSDFVALLNQTMEFAYPSVTITGELANFRVSRNRWVYFDLKDELSSVKFFGTVYQLPGPLEDGMLIKVRGVPRLHNLYGFSVNVMSMQPAGEGSLRRAADLLKMKLEAEGLFDEARKRSLPYPPSRIGLITAKQSAAYADFTKIINARWQGVEIDFVDVQVQGETAPPQIVAALNQLNELAEPPEIVVLVRGGGSAEDLAAFSAESVVRAVAASRVPTLVAIGHEIDLSLAELAADRRASTPSNAAELLVPDKQDMLASLNSLQQQFNQAIDYQFQTVKTHVNQQSNDLQLHVDQIFKQAEQNIKTANDLLEILNPVAILRRGYAVVRQNGHAIKTAKAVDSEQPIEIQLAKGYLDANITKVRS